MALIFSSITHQGWVGAVVPTSFRARPSVASRFSQYCRPDGADLAADSLWLILLRIYAAHRPAGGGAPGNPASSCYLADYDVVV